MRLWQLWGHGILNWQACSSRPLCGKITHRLGDGRMCIFLLWEDSEKIKMCMGSWAWGLHQYQNDGGYPYSSGHMEPRTVYSVAFGIPSCHPAFTSLQLGCEEGITGWEAAREEWPSRLCCHLTLRWTFCCDLFVILVSAQISGWSQKCHTFLRECAQVYFMHFYLVTQGHLPNRRVWTLRLGRKYTKNAHFKEVGIIPIIFYNVPQTQLLRRPT